MPPANHTNRFGSLGKEQTASSEVCRREIIALDPAQPGTHYVYSESSSGRCFIEVLRVDAVRNGEASPEIIEPERFTATCVDGKSLQDWIDRALAHRARKKAGRPRAASLGSRRNPPRKTRL